MKRAILLSILTVGILSCGFAQAVDKSKPVLMIVADKDFFDPEYVQPKAALESEGYKVRLASIGGVKAVGLNGLEVKPDVAVAKASAEQYSALMLVGGYGAVQFYGNKPLIALIQDFHAQGKLIGAQCFSPVVVAEAGLLNGANATCWSTQSSLLNSAGASYTGNTVEVSGRIVTGVSGTDPNIREFIAMYAKGLRGELPQASVQASAKATILDGPLKVSGDKKKFSMAYAGVERTGELFVPALDPKQPVSLLIGLHGMGSNGAAFQQGGFDGYAQRRNFVNVYPDAINGAWEVEAGLKGQHDDIGFLRRLIAEVSKQYGVDPERIYVTGHSNGGFMSYRVANELSDIVTAIAPVAGVFVGAGLSPADSKAGAVALLDLHAADDNVVPLRGIPGYSMSVDQGIAFWAKINGAAATPQTTNLGGKVRRVWAGSSPVVSVTVPSGGHAWLPGYTDEIMDFFYNTPARAVRIGFEAPLAAVLPVRPITVKPALSGGAQVSKVELLSGTTVLATAAAAPFTLSFTPQDKTRYELELSAVLKDGTRVPSGGKLGITVVPANLAWKKAAVSSSDENASLSAAKAVDGDFTTRWGSGTTDAETLTVDLGAVRDVQGVSLFWEVAAAAAYRIRVSADGKTWTEAVRIKDGKGGVEVLSFTPQKARYVRFEGEKRATPWGYSLWEMMVH